MDEQYELQAVAEQVLLGEVEYGGVVGLRLREATSQELHGLAGRFMKHQMNEDLSDGQDWLYGRVICELERRARREPRAWKRCTCSLCWSPFPDAPEPEGAHGPPQAV
jgi:hypothetical protein